MPAVTNCPMRRWLFSSHLPISADRSCCVPSPLSPVSGPIAGLVANGMRFRVRALHSPVSCSLDGGETENWIVGGFLQCVLSSRPGWRTFRYERHSSSFFPALPRSLARCCSRARRRFDVLLQALRVWVSSNKFPAPRTRWKFLAGASAESTSRPWERGTLASLRARVSRGSSGQKPTWRKSSWHSTKTLSA